MKRRDFLQYTGALAAHSILVSAVSETFFVSTSFGQAVAVDSLRRMLDPQEALILVPKDAQFESYNVSFNKRVMKTPSVRALCSTPEAVVTCLQWARDNGVPLALRCGGHSYEGFSQTTGLVIDTRPMNQFEFSGDDFTVGAGATLGLVYQTLTDRGLIIPAGSCPTVGVTGHTTGGGYGLLARPLGLACDSLTGIDLVDARGKHIFASESQNADLFWACRGAGGGSFGIVTKLHFRAHRVKNATVFSLRWIVRPERAAAFMKMWQQWAPNAPRQITPIMKIARTKKFADVAGGIDENYIAVRLIGQSIGTETALRKELEPFVKLGEPERNTLKTLPMMDAIKNFAGTDTSTPSVFMKGKSDYLKGVMKDESIAAFLRQIPVGPLDVMFDAYGGAIRDKKDADTAFAHRENTVSSLQYYTEWTNPKLTDQYLAKMRTFHDVMRPHMSGSAYVNYCDLDIKDYAQAYWGSNLERLVTIKSQVDPENVFRHAQSVPLKS